jgi:hypothetical protein
MSVKTYGGKGQQTYRTPPTLLAPVYEYFGKVVDLDPCSHPGSLVRCRMQILLPEYEEALTTQCGGYQPEAHTFFGDGLSSEADFMWAKAKSIWVNPPFRAVPAWLARVRRAAFQGAEVIVLTNADVSTKWFHEVVFRDADAVGFFKGRKKFIGATHTNPWPHLYSYFGPHKDEFRQMFSRYGVSW